MNSRFETAKTQFIKCCVDQPRYRVAWLIGKPLSGKSKLAQELSTILNWHYINYTTTLGYFDSLRLTIASYQPLDFIKAIQSWCMNTQSEVLILDEIDALLACWSNDQRRVWISQIARLTGLPCGLILVSHLVDYTVLGAYIPDNDGRYVVQLGEDNESITTKL
ncbi:hypothetical protein [Herpetosiphon gulosus]|uniref:ATPase AAA-type core domain-containing protein n=1 Tax=Herpetosiphon gulosus TaxID=1973496 RepID=A0ABP9X0A1_9CHLR